MILHKIHTRPTIQHNWLGFELIYETLTHFFFLSLDENNELRPITGIYAREKSSMKKMERQENDCCLDECYDVIAVLDYEFRTGTPMNEWFEQENGVNKHD